MRKEGKGGDHGTEEREPAAPRGGEPASKNQKKKKKKKGLDRVQGKNRPPQKKKTRVCPEGEPIAWKKKVTNWERRVARWGNRKTVAVQQRKEAQNGALYTVGGKPIAVKENSHGGGEVISFREGTWARFEGRKKRRPLGKGKKRQAMSAGGEKRLVCNSGKGPYLLTRWGGKKTKRPRLSEGGKEGGGVERRGGKKGCL